MFIFHFLSLTLYFLFVLVFVFLIVFLFFKFYLPFLLRLPLLLPILTVNFHCSSCSSRSLSSSSPSFSSSSKYIISYNFHSSSSSFSYLFPPPRQRPQPISGGRAQKRLCTSLLPDNEHSSQNARNNIVRRRTTADSLSTAQLSDQRIRVFKQAKWETKLSTNQNPSDHSWEPIREELVTFPSTRRFCGGSEQWEERKA